MHFPGFPQCDPHGLIGTQQAGPGAMIAIELAGGFDAASDLTANVRLFTHAVSLGSVDSLIQHPAALTHRPVQSDAKPSDALVRLSIGLEDPADLIADLEQAFAASRGAARRAEPLAHRRADASSRRPDSALDGSATRGRASGRGRA